MGISKARILKIYYFSLNRDLIGGGTPTYANTVCVKPQQEEMPIRLLSEYNLTFSP